MAAVISGNGLGLFNGSFSQLGQGLGSGRLDQGRDSQYVNIANGNLLLRSQDESLVFRGLSLSQVRTYNSQGQLSQVGGDAWNISDEELVRLEQDYAPALSGTPDLTARVDPGVTVIGQRPLASPEQRLAVDQFMRQMQADYERVRPLGVDEKIHLDIPEVTQEQLDHYRKTGFTRLPGYYPVDPTIEAKRELNQRAIEAAANNPFAAMAGLLTYALGGSDEDAQRAMIKNDDFTGPILDAHPGLSKPGCIVREHRALASRSRRGRGVSKGEMEQMEEMNRILRLAESSRDEAESVRLKRSPIQDLDPRVGVPWRVDVGSAGPVVEHDVFGNEIFYRAMPESHYKRILEGDLALVGTGETSLSPIESYANKYDGVLVRITVRPGTSDALRAIAVAGNEATVGRIPGLEVRDGNWGMTHARLKLEKSNIPALNGGNGVITIQLGAEGGRALNLFNDNVLKIERIREGLVGHDRF